MPWLWDLDIAQLPDELNWRAVYHDLWNRCIATSQSRNLGLVNRKKIWTRSLEIAEKFRIRTLERTGQEEEEAGRVATANNEPFSMDILMG